MMYMAWDDSSCTFEDHRHNCEQEGLDQPYAVEIRWAGLIK